MNSSPDPSAELVALTRFKAVSYIEEEIRKQVLLAEALRLASLRPWPDENGRYYAMRTIEDWWYIYHRDGFEGLKPRTRKDQGSSKSIDPELGAWILEQVRAHPTLKIKVLYEHWCKQGRELPSLRSVYRYIQRHNHDHKPSSSGPTKAFEMPYVNDLWMVDFSVGPRLQVGEQMMSTHLCVLIDDCSRLIPFAAYAQRANTEAFHHTLQQAVLRRGVPVKLYTDQGSPFINHHTRIVCANLGIRLLHAKPYHSWSKGKVERVIQTIQQGFEAILQLEGQAVGSIGELNQAFSTWIQTVYHQREHSAIQCSPELRYQKQVDRIRQVPCDSNELDVLFYTRIERRVRKDGTVRIDNQIYEVDLSLRSLRVQLRFNPYRLDRIEVWHADGFVGLAQPVNLQLNAETQGDNHANA